MNNLDGVPEEGVVMGEPDLGRNVGRLTMAGRIQGVFPRTCVKVTVLIFGILIVMLGGVGVIFAIMGIFSGGSLLDIAFIFLSFPALMCGGVCFISSAVMKKRNPKTDRFISTLSIVSFSILIALAVITILTKVLLGVIVGMSVTDEDVKDAEKNNEGEGNITKDSLRNVYIISGILSALITCCCCTLFCFPCLVLSYFNCVHTFPEFVGGEEESTTNTMDTDLGLQDQGFGQLVDEDEDMIPDDDVSAQQNQMDTNVTSDGISPPFVEAQVVPEVMPEEAIDYSNNNTIQSQDGDITFHQ